MNRTPYERMGVPRPVLNVVARDPLEQSETNLVAGVDTGFEGGLMIPLDDYLRLGLQGFEEPKSDVVARSTLGIAVRLRSSRGVVDVGGSRFVCGFYTTPLLLRPLLGRELLNKWKVSLDGPKAELAVDF